MTEALRLTNITKSFAQGGEAFFVLNEANMIINKGDVVALVGPSGSGKSTLLQLAGLVDKPDKGSIIIDNKECSVLNEADLTKIRREHIGFVFQFHHLLPEFTALENAAMPLLINGVDSKIAFEKAKNILDELGLSDKYNNLPSQLSGGEQQRVAIGRAVVHSPKIIFADEPTGSLDPANAVNIFNIFYQAVKNHNSAALIVTHNLELAKKADKILTIQNGQIYRVNVK